MSGSLPVAVTRMTFDDEFNSFVSSADGSTGWMTTFPYGGAAAYTLAGNHEAEYYGSSSSGLNPFSAQNGVLNITATPANGSNSLGLPYNSGLITTDKSFSQTYGYFEVNAKLPAGQGLWPAFWLLPASNVYTAELDVFEQLGNAPSTIYSTVHGTTGGSWGSNSQAFTVANTATAFHTYGVDWEPTTTTYYMDGVALGSAPTPTSMNSPMFMLLNLAVGGAGSWPGAVTSSTTLPASLQINYVHAYATAGTTFVGGPSALPVVASQPASTLVLNISEDAWQGDAQYTVSVDGVQQGGVLTATASHAAGADQAVSITGTWDSGAHVVAVSFLNDAWGGSVSTDRNLHVDSVTLGGVAGANAPATLFCNGTTTFAIAAVAAATVPASVVTPVSAGSPSATLTLLMAEDAWQGDAQYTVSVDGVQQGGVRTATASQAAGATQSVSITGTWDTGAHTVNVAFLNDTYGGSAAADRNLHVDGVTLGGVSAPNTPATLWSDGNMTFAIAAAAPSVVVPVQAASPAFAQTLTLQVSEDAWQGDAQYQLSVDGVDVGGLRMATASHAAGQSQAVSVTGNWDSGAHSIGVNFVNDLYGGSALTDRNLYVDSASLGGVAAAGAPAAVMRGGPVSFLVPPNPSTTLVLNLSEDAYLGDARFTVAVDGVQLGAVQSVTSLHAGGGFEAFGFADVVKSGTHDVAVSFLNDLYGGSPTLDRNLYVDGASVNGVAVSGAASSLLWTATNHFSIVVK